MTSIGTYFPANSFFHRVDPRLKLFSIVAIIVCIFLSYPAVTLFLTSWDLIFICNASLLLLGVICMLISRINILAILNSLKAVAFLMIFLFVINVFLPSSNAMKGHDDLGIAFAIGTVDVMWNSILLTVQILLRLVTMFTFALVLTGTTKPMDLNYAMEWYLAPLKLIKVPVHIFAMMMSLALRFIPTLLDETKQLMKAQSSRGLDYEKGNIVMKFRGIIALIVPLFVSAFTRSTELTNAMIARGYDPYAKRTRYRKLSFHLEDLFVLIFILSILAGFILLRLFEYL